MNPTQRADDEAARVLEALRRRIRLAGLSFRQVEERMGKRHDYLRQVFAGAIELRYKHVAAILAALNAPPAEFFAEVYGPAAPAGAEEFPPSYPLSALLVAHGSLHVLIWRLRDKGVLSEDVVQMLVTELEHDREREQRRLAGGE